MNRDKKGRFEKDGVLDKFVKNVAEKKLMVTPTYLYENEDIKDIPKLHSDTYEEHKKMANEYGRIIKINGKDIENPLYEKQDPVYKKMSKVKVLPLHTCVDCKCKIPRHTTRCTKCWREHRSKDTALLAFEIENKTLQGHISALEKFNTELLLKSSKKMKHLTLQHDVVYSKPLFKEESILEEAERITTGERNVDYGTPYESCQKIVLMINALFSHKLKTPFEPEDFPLIMQCLKMSREVHKHKRDNVVDGAGYWNVLDMIHSEMEKGEKK